MTDPLAPNEPVSLQRLHVRPKKYLEQWLDVPAHVHHVSYRMSDPPRDRPRSRQDFLQVLRRLVMSESDCAVAEKIGYGARVEENGDRLVVIWEAHTEYYSYQIWHIPDDKTLPLEFGPLSIPGFEIPVTPAGTPISELDLIFSQEREIAPELVRALLPGRSVYASRVFGGDITVLTSFTPDELSRERYLIFSSEPKTLLAHLGQLTDAVVTIENYY
ncbi:MAG TPA: DUF3422 family protein, partial [Nitrospiria bacterium]|nr:DUF3422 family protein [Nitrospiria bacterium]